MSDRLTEDRIVLLARRPGGFTVSRRYRDERLMRRCRKLVAVGELVVKRLPKDAPGWMKAHVTFVSAEPRGTAGEGGEAVRTSNESSAT